MTTNKAIKIFNDFNTKLHDTDFDLWVKVAQQIGEIGLVISNEVTINSQTNE